MASRAWGAALLFGMLLVGCRLTTVPGTPNGGREPGHAAAAPGALPNGGTAGPSPSPSAPVLASDGSAIPLAAQVVRDLRKVPVDFAYSRQGTYWLLALDGIWRRRADTDWQRVATLTELQFATIIAPAPELVADDSDTPWVLDRQSGRLWRGGSDGFALVTADLPHAQGLSVASDGTAYALAMDGTPGLYRVRNGNVLRMAGASWVEPATTGVTPAGDVFVVDPGMHAVALYGQNKLLAPVPGGTGTLTIGRDHDGAPLVVGGMRAPLVMRLGEKALSFPTMPTRVMPRLSEGRYEAIRLFVREPGRVVVMARDQSGGELREGWTPERKTDGSYLPSSAYTGRSLDIRPIAESEAARLGTGYRLYRISGRNLTSRALNGASAWVYEFVGPDNTVLAVSIGHLGRSTELVYLAQDPGPLPVLDTDGLIDADMAWAKAQQAGMNREARFDAALEVVDDRPVWRLTWVAGGQTYRVDARTGAAELESARRG